MTFAAQPAAAVRTPLTFDAARAALAEHADLLEQEAVRADRTATVPQASIDALRTAGLWSAAIPQEFGGHGLGAVELARLGMQLGGHCSATAMIWAMHQLQVACLAGSATGQPVLADYLRRAAAEQLLIASVTSEAGIGGNLRASSAAAVRLGTEVEFEKQATTVSYGAVADAFLISLRRDETASASDQVLVLAERAQLDLRQTGGWNTLGMRGTGSPAFLVRGTVPADQVLAEPFGSIAARCMVPLSHLLWAGVWTGVANDAIRRAARFTRAKARSAARAGNPHTDERLGQAYARLRLLQGAVLHFANEYADRGAREDDSSLTVQANALKTAVSVDASRIVEGALEICGMAGYSEDGPYSVARHIRDLYSARLMVSNRQIDLANSDMLLFGERMFQQ
ncbi:acyl-CoA dehydrogenase family protein [Streptomyces sp. SID5643]|uniref:acyl-CoA dehydrogenase family protein n=1 Tax=Streptomyces sp. SID5643 TaxID=2690307 RepID=UPI00136FB941|nr:acyl-CoA dehydrogenase family protein [Streptomyces sp. SID5643]MZF89101.1 acyl-CoA dehydrogenase [Streptomyces sp. SID5643]